VAREDGRDEAAIKKLAIIKREQDRSFWSRINYTCGKVKGKNPTSIQVPRNGRDNLIDEYSTQATGHEAIWAKISTTSDSTSQKKPPSAKDGCAWTSAIMHPRGEVHIPGGILPSHKRAVQGMHINPQNHP
jgi:hypothetical protein